MQYATYVLNRSPSNANLNRTFPIEVLNGKNPSIADIVVLGRSCTAHRDPGKKSWIPRAEVGIIVGRHTTRPKGLRYIYPVNNWS